MIQIHIHIAANRLELGESAAAAIAAAMREQIAAQGRVRMVFGAAPSQNETLAVLAATPGLDWSRVTAFHLDEYVGVRADAASSFRHYLQEHLFSRVRGATFHGMQGEAADPAEECRRYASLLQESPPDIMLLGIGENGHLAFNDPPCDFDDPASVKIVALAESCRVQQVHDGAFAALAEVPRSAITLTVPEVLRAPALFLMAPGPTKAAAVQRAWEGPISPDCPASILRTHPRVSMFLDRESAARLRVPR